MGLKACRVDFILLMLVCYCRDWPGGLARNAFLNVKTGNILLTNMHLTLHYIGTCSVK